MKALGGRGRGRGRGQKRPRSGQESSVGRVSKVGGGGFTGGRLEAAKRMLISSFSEYDETGQWRMLRGARCSRHGAASFPRARRSYALTDQKNSPSHPTCAAMLRTEFPAGTTVDLDLECPFLVHVKLTPTEGLYRGVEWPFHIKFAMAEHPFSCPHAWCHKKIWHPNIDLAGTVCNQIFHMPSAGGAWNPTFGLQECIRGLWINLQEPNEADPNNQDAAKEMITDRLKFEGNCATARERGTIDTASGRKSGFCQTLATFASFDIGAERTKLRASS